MMPGYIIGKIVVDSKPEKWTQDARLWVFGAVAYYGFGIGVSYASEINCFGAPPKVA